MTLIYSIIVFLFVILVHEFGHFAVAKLCGIKVNEFSIGMGPLIAKKMTKETQYSLRALPIGGYVAMEGEDEESNDPRSFQNAAPLKKIAVLIAGAGMNFLLAISVLFIFFINTGVSSTIIESTIPNSPAQNIGISANDRILEIDGIKIKEWNDISEAINNSEKDILPIKFESNGKIIEKEFTPNVEAGQKTLGIISKRVMDPKKSITSAFGATFDIIKGVVLFIIHLFTGKQNISNLSGPVGVVRIIGRSGQMGFIYFIYIFGAISANIGAFNLLPLPALDGGKVFLTLIEMLTKKRVPEKVESAISQVGLILLLGLVVYITIFNDIL